MITLDTLNRWLTAPAESECLEFKEAKQQFDTTRLMRYCAALANEGGGHLVLGVSDKAPRRIVGSKAFAAVEHLNDLKARVVEKLRMRIEATELQTPDGRVLVITVPARARGQAVDFDGAYLMRAGEDLVPMTQDRLRAIFAEGQGDWLRRLQRSMSMPMASSPCWIRRASSICWVTRTRPIATRCWTSWQVSG